MKKTPCAALALFFLVTCARPGQAPEAPAAKPPAASAGDKASAQAGLESSEVTSLARAIAGELTLEEKCAQLLMLAAGTQTHIPRALAKTLAEVPAGAVLLLGYNIAENAEDIMRFTSALQDIALSRSLGIPFFIAVDHEGGSVYRFGDTATRLPGASRVGELLEGGTGEEEIEALYRNAARQLSLLGFSLNLAPVLEARGAENRGFLTTRTYSESPLTVSRAGGLVLKAMRETGVLAAAKHFPGTGDADPHSVLPRLSPRAASPGSPGLQPFSEAVFSQGLAALMLSHAAAPGFDTELPVTLSAKVQQGFLRETLGFRGIILTDDINMKALTHDRAPEEAAVMAVAAGADMIMYLDEYAPRVRDALANAVKEGLLPETRVEEAAVRIIEEKLRLGLWLKTRDLAGRSLDTRREEFRLLKEEGDALAASLVSRK